MKCVSWLQIFAENNAFNTSVRWKYFSSSITGLLAKLFDMKMKHERWWAKFSHQHENSLSLCSLQSTKKAAETPNPHNAKSNMLYIRLAACFHLANNANSNMLSLSHFQQGLVDGKAKESAPTSQRKSCRATFCSAAAVNFPSSSLVFPIKARREEGTAEFSIIK